MTKSKGTTTTRSSKSIRKPAAPRKNASFAYISMLPSHRRESLANSATGTVLHNSRRRLSRMSPILRIKDLVTFEDMRKEMERVREGLLNAGMIQDGALKRHQCDKSHNEEMAPSQTLSDRCTTLEHMHRENNCVPVGEPFSLVASSAKTLSIDTQTNNSAVQSPSLGGTQQDDSPTSQTPAPSPVSTHSQAVHTPTHPQPTITSLPCSTERDYIILKTSGSIFESWPADILYQFSRFLFEDDMSVEFVPEDHFLNGIRLKNSTDLQRRVVWRGAQILPIGTCIGEYRGAFQPLPAWNFSGYSWQVSENAHVDAKDQGSYLRFVNHFENIDSKPNCKGVASKEKGTETYRVFFVCTKDIYPGDEVLIDYGVKAHNGKMDCLQYSPDEIAAALRKQHQQLNDKKEGNGQGVAVASHGLQKAECEEVKISSDPPHGSVEAPR
uniref:SET domain-containing protein n=1 Tax=Percolomonas cosmopolitus TaxID=63605 RepID=A0A7S1PIJ0_9EUKA